MVSTTGIEPGTEVMGVMDMIAAPVFMKEVGGGGGGVGLQRWPVFTTLLIPTQWKSFIIAHLCHLSV
jgi:hypothetical protein